MEASDFIAICSVIAAASAVGATIYQSRLSHRHDRLTVQPFLAWSESYVQENHGTFLTFALKNHGQGPAIIKDRWFEIDGKRFAPTRSANYLREIGPCAVTWQCFLSCLLAWPARRCLPYCSKPATL